MSSPFTTSKLGLQLQSLTSPVSNYHLGLPSSLSFDPKFIISHHSYARHLIICRLGLDQINSPGVSANRSGHSADKVKPNQMFPHVIVAFL